MLELPAQLSYLGPTVDKPRCEHLLERSLAMPPNSRSSFFLMLTLAQRGTLVLMRHFRMHLVPIALSLILALPVAANANATSPRGTACELDRSTGSTIDRIPVLSGGYGLVYNAATRRIAYMQPDSSGFYRVITSSAHGFDRRDLDAGSLNIPRKHQGTPEWDPSGRWLIFTAQKAAWSGRTIAGIPDYEALPGYGRHDDLWIASADGRYARQLTDDPNTKDEGVLIPVFSNDGKRIAWSARQPGGTYELRVADLVRSPAPHLENVRTYRPGGAVYYETGAFTSDGTGLTYTSDQDTHSFWQSQIYVLNLAIGTDKRLTSGTYYDEHPVIVPTPSGDWIVYMSTQGVNRRPFHLLLGTDWYAMRLDGTGTKRVTTMNSNAPDNPENTGAVQVAGRVEPGPTPDVLFGGIQDNLVKQTGSTKRIRLACK
jgi:hypothetical protein